MNPLVSIVITTYNRNELLLHAVNSATNQTYKEIEIIVVDDYSDDSVESYLAKKLVGKKIIVLTHTENRGLSAARNTGLNQARGKYVAYLDDDDTWNAERIRLQVEGAEKTGKEYGVYYCGKTVRKHNGECVSILPIYSGDLFDVLLRKKVTPPPSTLFFRRDAICSIGGFDEKLVSCIDHDVWFAMASAGFKIDFVPYALVACNPHSHTLMRMTSNPLKRIDGIKTFLKKWKKDIVENVGENIYAKFEKQYFSNSYQIIGISYNGKRKYWVKIKMFLSSIYYNPKNIKSIMLLIANVLKITKIR